MALQTSSGWAALKGLRGWMSKPLQYGILRVNTLRITPEEALERTQTWLIKQASRQGRPVPEACIHPTLREVISISAWPDATPSTELSPDKADLPVVIVDASCANAVLRGAPIFQAGILAASDNISVNSEVRIDVFREGFRKWIAYGIVRSDPETWETKPACQGDLPKYDYAVGITGGLSILPPTPRDLVEGGFIALQSVPSIVCSHVLDPQPGHRILDFGAGTGYMSSHIAALTSNEAEITAVDHSASRLDTLVSRCKLLGAKVTPVHSDVNKFAKNESIGFDRVIVHPDHSVIGTRPMVVDLLGRGRGINGKIREFVEIAVNLLKPGGRLVYCTGSIVPVENDAVVRWLLDRRKDLKLEPAEPRVAREGVRNPLPTPSWMSLTPDEEKLVQRFGPGTPELESDPVLADVPGFFIACFSKVQS